MGTATDSLVLELADLENIVAVQERSQHPENSAHWKKASQVIGLRRGMAEEVYRLRPDLVLLGQWSNRSTVELLRKLEVPVHRLGGSRTWDALYEDILRMGKLMGTGEKAEMMCGEMQARLDKIAKRLEGHPPLRGICFIGRGNTYGSNSKHHLVMNSAGITNIAAELGIHGLGKLSVEELILCEPDIIIISDYHKNTPSLSRQILSHPALQHLKRSIIEVELPARDMNTADISLINCVEELALAAHPDAFEPYLNEATSE